MRLDRYFVLFRGTCMASRTKEAVPIAGSIHCNGTKEMMQPCLICLHPISLVASSLSSGFECVRSGWQSRDQRDCSGHSASPMHPLP